MKVVARAATGGSTANAQIGSPRQLSPMQVASSPSAARRRQVAAYVRCGKRTASPAPGSSRRSAQSVSATWNTTRVYCSALRLLFRALTLAALHCAVEVVPVRAQEGARRDDQPPPAPAKPVLTRP